MEHTVTNGTHPEAPATTIAMLEANEEWLMEQILAYAKMQGYTPYTSTLVCAWRISITGISQAIVEACKLDREPIGFTPSDDNEHNPVATFARLEATAHRQRGISLGMFLGLLKYYREAYIDLIETFLPPRSPEDRLPHDCCKIITRCFDLFEIALATDWNATTLDAVVEELRESTRQLTNEKNFYLTAFESLHEPAFLLDEERRILGLNDAAISLAGGKYRSSGEMYYRQQVEDIQGHDYGPGTGAREEYLGKSVTQLFPSLTPILRPDVDDDMSNASHREITIQVGGRAQAFICSRSPMLDVSGKFRGSVLFLTDITDQKQLETELRGLAERDALTGALNRRSLDALLAAEVYRAQRLGQPLSVIAIDIDHFKQINDLHGHALGDKALINVATSCMSATRASDSFARIGGEEFLIVLRSTTLDTAVELAERLRLRLSLDCRLIDRTEINLTVSMGVAEFKLDSGTTESLMQEADAALYAAKAAGRNTVALAEHSGLLRRVDGGQIQNWMETRRSPEISRDLVGDLLTLTRALSKLRGEEFVTTTVATLAQITGMDYVFVASADKAQGMAYTQCLYVDGEQASNISYALADTPCAVVTATSTCIFPKDVRDQFPADELLEEFSVESYIGVPLFDSHREFDGLLVAMSRAPIEKQEYLLTLFDFAGTTLASELERLANERRISELVETDPLTGFASKTALQKHLAAPGHKHLLIAALDGIGLINNAYGFSVGDGVIKSTARLIRKHFAADVYATLGPTKFVLLYRRPMDLAQVAGEIRRFFAREPVETGALDAYISFHFGAAQGEDDLLRIATRELQHARSTGSTRVDTPTSHDDNSERRTHQRLIKSSNIVHRAIEERRILPLFQRIVRLEDESTHGVECLARIVDKNEVLEPSEFIAAASATGTMPAITREMVSRVFEVMHHHSIEFSLNVSEFDLEEHYLLDYLLAQAGRFEVKPERVTLELLETISSSRRSAHIAQLLELKKAGFKLAIDDFGAEYSSFSRILELDVDYLKIDAKFVTRVHMDDRCREIIKAIVYFCRNAGILSVAEHVDSVEIANELRAIGVDFAQGFLFAQPQRSPE